MTRQWNSKVLLCLRRCRKKRRLWAVWTAEAEQDLQAMYGIFADEATARVAADIRNMRRGIVLIGGA